MLTIFTRSVLLYIASVLAMRAMGKREVGQLQPFELVVVIMIAELAATPMGGVGIPLLYGILPMVALVVCHGIITALCMRCQWFRTWLSGQPTVLMRNGVICEKQMRKTAMDLNDLMEAIRTAGILDPAEVGTVVLEPGGQVNVFPKADYRSVTPKDMNDSRSGRFAAAPCAGWCAPAGQPCPRGTYRGMAASKGKGCRICFIVGGAVPVPEYAG